MADKNTKAKTLKTYKTATGAQQYGDQDAWRKVERKVFRDFMDMSSADFKKKHGVEAHRAMQKVWAGKEAADAKKYKELGMGDRLVKQAEGFEKKWQEGSKKKGSAKMARGGMAKYNKGGYANCGASMKPTQKATMMCGGMAHKKK